MKTFLSCLAAALVVVMTAGIAEAGDAGKGEKVYKKKCKACHTVDAGGKHTVGPNLHGISGATAGQIAGFTKYSEAMKGSGITWDAGNLDAYLEKPKKFMPGTKMAFPGLKKAGDRTNVIAYLETLK